MARVVAIDLGTKRIGVACSDVTRTLASPHVVIERRGSLAADHAALKREIEELEADCVVVGLPIGLNGRDGHAARSVRTEVESLRQALSPIPVEFVDERFTTVTAHRSLQERNMRADARRKVVDKVAAAVMLQNWLDAQPRVDSVAKRGSATAPGVTEGGAGSDEGRA